MAPVTPDPAELLPLSEAVLQILLTLADAPRHGYGIMQEVEERTGGRVRLGPGTLYGAVKRLRERGLIDEVAEADALRAARGANKAGPDVSGRAGDDRRRYYGLTPLGRRVARLEVERLARLVETARRKRLVGEGGLP